MHGSTRVVPNATSLLLHFQQCQPCGGNALWMPRKLWVYGYAGLHNKYHIYSSSHSVFRFTFHCILTGVPAKFIPFDNASMVRPNQNGRVEEDVSPRSGRCDVSFSISAISNFAWLYLCFGGYSQSSTGRASTGRCASRVHVSRAQLLS